MKPLLALSLAIKRSVVLRFPDVDGKWMAQLEGAEIREGSTLSGACGRGNSAEYAIEDYWSQIQGHILVFGANTSERKEIYIAADTPRED